MSVIRIDAQDSRELRRSVLRPNLPVGSELPGDTDLGVLHLGAYRDELLVSACLILPQTCPWRPGEPAWRLRGVASDPRHRGAGGGTALLGAAAEITRSEGASLLWCLARQGAIGFYRHNGWRGVGNIFGTEIGPHLQMWLPLRPAET